MTGLDLETFLRLLRVAPGAWASLGAAVVILALMTWTSWGSRRALRKCLFLSIAAHVGLLAYGGSSPILRRYLRIDPPPRRAEPKVERIRVTSVVEPAPNRDAAGRPIEGTPRPAAVWDLAKGTLAMADPARRPPRPDRVEPAAPPPVEAPRVEPAPLPTPAAPEVAAPAPDPVEPPRAAAPPSELAPVAESTLAAVAPDPGAIAPAPEPAPAAAPEPTPTPAAGAGDLRARSRPRTPLDRPSPAPAAIPPVAASAPPTLPPASPAPAPDRDLIPPPALDPAAATTPDPARAAALPPVEPPAVASADALAPATPDPVDPPVAAPAAATPAPALAADLGSGVDLRRSARLGRPAPAPDATPRPAPTRPSPDDPATDAGLLARATPSIAATMPAPSPTRPSGRRSLADVPPVYRSRLDPNRTALAQRAGASAASEQAVERALVWLARHQDADGRWNAGQSKGRDGRAAENDASYTVHCDPGDVCFGECLYAEADTALTGLSLLAYLGAGYTHVDGKYADAVGRGIGFLRRSQKPDGDLRGTSLSVGMYCHAMATLALCEAYALTGDLELRDPVRRGVDFLLKSRAVDDMAWRYAPRAPMGDTSILGWVVMALKSAKTVGFPIPPEVQSGIDAWLKQVAGGRSGGMARYQPVEGSKIAPTMTAEAWACRQFLELGGPGPASDEAAAYLLATPEDRGKFNVYYLYYGTLAMYQHGGPAWAGWNARVRDLVVSRQQARGHKAGSWDPDDSPYGPYGGRIYSTALATLTLEVYYRFLRLYTPATPAAAPANPWPADAATRRTGLAPAGAAPASAPAPARPPAASRPGQASGAVGSP